MKGKKIINSPDDLIPEILEGMVLASHGKLKLVEGASTLVRTDMPDDKVALLIGGGSGHEPMYTAYVGDGWADGSGAGSVEPAVALPTT